MGSVNKEVESLGLSAWSTCADVYKKVQELDRNLLKSLAESTTIVTGSNTGIGKKTAAYLAYLGGNVIVACRNVKKAEEAIQSMRAEAKVEGAKMGLDLKGENLKLMAMELDLGSFAKVRKFVDAFSALVQAKKIPKLRLIVCNAGLMTYTEPFTSVDGFEHTFAVNHLGHFLLVTELVKKNIWSNDGGRAIVLASHGHYGPFTTSNVTDEKTMREYVFKHFPGLFLPWIRTYDNSKLANVMFAESVNGSSLPNGKKLVACSVHPGTFVATDFARQSYIMTKLMKFSSVFTKSIDQGSSTSFLCSMLPDEMLNGQYWADCCIWSPSKLNQGENGRIARELLWKLSEEAVSGVFFKN